MDLQNFDFDTVTDTIDYIDRSSITYEEEEEPDYSWETSIYTVQADANHYLHNSSGILIIFIPEDGMFPQYWIDPPTSITSEPILEEHKDRALSLLEPTLDKYPSSFLYKHLKKIYVLDYLEWNGAEASGTTYGQQLFLVLNNSIPDYWLQKTMHHEFAHLLKDKYGDDNFNAIWASINAPGIEYYGDVADLSDENLPTSTELDYDLMQKGLLTPYSQASIEEDFAVLIENIFHGDFQFWEAVDKYPKISQKVDLAIGLYSKLDPTFTEVYFRGLE